MLTVAFHRLLSVSVSVALLSRRLSFPIPSRLVIMRAIAAARSKVEGLPTRFSYHDLRHYLASLLIASGADIKTVQARLRHATASTTLDTYGHLWPDAAESTRTVIGAVIRDHLAATADALRTDAPSL